MLEDEELVAGTEKKGVVGLWGLVLILHRPEDDDVLGRYLWLCLDPEKMVKKVTLDTVAFFACL